MNQIERRMARPIISESASAEVLKNTSIPILAGIVILLIGHYAFSRGNVVLTALCFSISAVLTLLFKRDFSICLFLFLIPSNRILTIGPISVLSIIALAHFLKYYFLFRHAGKMSIALLFSSILLSLYSCLQSAIDQSLSPLLSSIKIVLVLLFLTDVFKSTAIGREPTSMAEVMSIGIVFSVLIGQIADPSSLGDVERLTVGNESGQNVLGITCSFAADVLLLDMYKKGISGSSLFMMIAMCIIGVMTGSRSFLLSFLIGFFCIIASALTSLSSKKILRMAAVLIAFLILALFVLEFIPATREFLINLIDRIVNPRNGDISNDRFNIWVDYFEAFRDNADVLLFGTSMLSNFGLEIVAHNFVLEQIASYGIIGSLFVFSAYCCAFRDMEEGQIFKTQTMVRRTIADFSPLLVLLSASFFSHTLLGIPQTTMLFISIVLIWRPYGKK